MKKIIILILIIIIPISLLTMIDNYFSERSKIYIENTINKTITTILTTSLDNVIDQYLTNNIIECNYGQDSQIKSIYINSYITNQIIVTLNQKINELLTQEIIEKELNKIEIPVSLLIFKSIFTSIGPNVKIKVLPILSYKTDIITNTTNTGINNSTLEVYAIIKFDVETIIPLIKNKVSYESRILLANMLIQGEIPYYYYQSGANSMYPMPR